MQTFIQIRQISQNELVLERTLYLRNQLQWLATARVPPNGQPIFGTERIRHEWAKKTINNLKQVVKALFPSRSCLVI